MYRYTQCATCNSLLGALYDERFGAWWEETLQIIRPGLVICVQPKYKLVCRYPLSLLKRIAAMFFSIHGPEFTAKNRALADFVLDGASRSLPSEYRFYVALTFNDIVAHIPIQVRYNVRSREQIFVSQITHPPFVYLMAFTKKFRDSRRTEITHFSEFSYDQEGDARRTFRVVPTVFGLAGDFRDAGKVIPNDVIVLNTALRPRYFRIVRPEIKLA